MKNIEPKKYDYIDAIRGIAILGVVFVHSSRWINPPSEILSRISDEGARGVQLFFIASALTLFLSLECRQEKEEKPLLSFFIRRFFRIAPAFYLAIIVYTVDSGMSVRHWAPNGLEWWYIPLTAFFLHGWHPEVMSSVVPGSWSIADEMTFYLCVPYLFAKLTSIRSTLIALFLSLFFAKITKIIIVYFLSQIYPDSQFYLVDTFSFLWFFFQFPVFILGILLYHIIKRYPSGDSTIALLLLLLSIFLFGGFLTASFLPRSLLYGIAFVIFSLSLHYSPQKILVNKITIFIGKLSYSIYLVHFMVLRILKSVFPDGSILDSNSNFLLAFLSVVVLSICVSYITYKVVEVPGIKLGKKIINKL